MDINWKERFKEQLLVDDDTLLTANPHVIKAFIKAQIIEKLIEDIPNHYNYVPGPYKNGEVIDGELTNLMNLKQQLREKWL